MIQDLKKKFKDADEEESVEKLESFIKEVSLKGLDEVNPTIISYNYQFCSYYLVTTVYFLYICTVVSHIYAYDRAKTLSFILYDVKALNLRMNQMSKV